MLIYYFFVSDDSPGSPRHQLNELASGGSWLERSTENEEGESFKTLCYSLLHAVTPPPVGLLGYVRVCGATIHISSVWKNLCGRITGGMRYYLCFHQVHRSASRDGISPNQYFSFMSRALGSGQIPPEKNFN